MLRRCEMIYFDNAATTKFKPYSVRRAAALVMKNGANPGRGEKTSDTWR